MNTEKKTTTEKGKGGRPRSESPASLEKRVISYFEAQEAAGRFPTESGMLLHLGLCGEKAQAALSNPKYAEIWERAKLRRMDWLENQMVTEPRAANGCMNALKQEKNGGYADRTVPENKPRQLKIIMDGVGKNAGK